MRGQTVGSIPAHSRNRAKVLLNPFIEVKAHGFCISNPEPTHLVALAGNPVLASDSAKRVKQILVGDRNNNVTVEIKCRQMEKDLITTDRRELQELLSQSDGVDIA